MNFSGWVKLRRGILHHIYDGRLTLHEAVALIVLIMLADKATGSYTINAPTLNTFVPGLKRHAAKRVLESLENKGYIFRRVQQFSTLPYQYWVNRYEITAGIHAGFQTDLAKVFQSKDPNDIAYIKSAPEGVPQGAPEGALETAHNNKNGEERSTNKNKKPNREGVKAPSTASTASTENGVVINTPKATQERPSALPGAAQRSALSTTNSSSNNAAPGAHHEKETDYSKVSADDLFKELGMKREGDWSGITAQQVLSFDPKSITSEQAFLADLRWDDSWHCFCDLVDDRPLSEPEAIRRLSRNS